jgi:DsbC/DsbD-like thiol-disulfide interchange protein
MQNLFHCYNLMNLSALLACFCLISPCAAEPGPRIGGSDPTAQSRLIASEAAHQTIYRAGVEITLKPGALTYWRQPGDAGVPPQFSFEGSENLKSAEVLYPAPSRIREDEGEAFGYQGKVVFPLHVMPKDVAKPVLLKLTADYAVCEKICIPVKAHMELALPVASAQARDAEIAAAEARVPVHLSQGETAEKLTILPQKDAQPTWVLTWKDAAQAGDLFAEAPAGWYFETKKAAKPGAFTIVAVEAPKSDATAPVAVSLTLTAPPGSANLNYEFTLPLKPANP